MAEEIKDPVKLITTVIRTGEKVETGPWERKMLTKWIEHQANECSGEICAYEMVEV